MTPGPPCRLTCPHCGGHKHIMSIASGNTFGGTIWSDSKRDFPMLPQPSVIQYCPHCGHYFFYTDGKPKDVDSGEEDTRKNRFGDLSFEQVDAAYDELTSGALSDERLNELLFLWLFIFNDVYNGRDKSESIPVVSPVLSQKHKAILDKLIALNEDNTLFVAEMYRELGNYAKCIELTKGVIDAKEDGAIVAKQFQKHAEMGDCKVFPLVFEE